MIVWIDAHLSPELAPWLAAEFGIDARPLRELGLRDAKDREIFQAARRARAIIMTKDADFPALLARLGPPLQVIWVTCGNTSSANLRAILRDALPTALQLLSAGEALVEIGTAREGR